MNIRPTFLQGVSKRLSEEQCVSVIFSKNMKGIRALSALSEMTDCVRFNDEEIPLISKIVNNSAWGGATNNEFDVFIGEDAWHSAPFGIAAVHGIKEILAIEKSPLNILQTQKPSRRLNLYSEIIGEIFTSDFSDMVRDCNMTAEHGLCRESDFYSIFLRIADKSNNAVYYSFDSWSGNMFVNGTIAHFCSDLNETHKVAMNAFDTFFERVTAPQKQAVEM